MKEKIKKYFGEVGKIVLFSSGLFAFVLTVMALIPDENIPASLTESWHGLFGRGYWLGWTGDAIVSGLVCGVLFGVIVGPFIALCTLTHDPARS